MDQEINTNKEGKKLLTRRNFTKGLIGTSLAFISASWMVLILKYLWPLGEKVEDDVVKIAETVEAPVGAVIERWKFKGIPALMFHDESGYKAFALKCTHLGCTAQWRNQHSGHDGPIIFCPCHDGVFDPVTGEVLAGPPPSQLPEIQVEEKGGTLYATGWKNPTYVESLAVYK